MSTFEVKGNPNYSAQVVEVKNLLDLPGLDNLVGLPVNGYTALVPKATTHVGDLLVVFPAEAQLSGEFARANNLFSDSEKNADPTAKGYLGSNRRVRAIRLRGNTSSALALPVSSLRHYLYDTEPLPAAGTSFDTINDTVICAKYELPVKGGPMAAKSMQEKVWKRVDDKFLPLHIDTLNYWRNAEKIGPDEWVVVTQKVHGTSVRIANTKVLRKPTWKDRLAARFGVKVADHEYAHVYGSRKVVKDTENPHQQHFYKDADGAPYDLWSTEGAKYADLLPEGVVLYGELYGWLPSGQPIQKGYTYDAPKGEARLLVYRVAVVGPDGGVYDLSWSGVEEFCAARGLKTVPVLWQGPHRDLDVDTWMDKVYDDEYPQALPLSDKGTVDEGLVIRAEGVLPRVLKAKSQIFLTHESKILDQGNEVLS